MKRIIIIFSFALLFLLPFMVSAEDKNAPGGIIPKLQRTTNDPELFNNFVYPMWGPACQRYTYTVTYRDKEGRPPEYMRIIFNDKPVDMEKANPNDNDYKNGVRYEYKFVPNRIGSNFYYFEASNGLGKTRASIIDSPDNGPVLFEGDFLHNEIAVVDSKTGKKILSYPTKEEWIGGVALSDDGRYLAAKTSNHIYLFNLNNPKEPEWVYKHNTGSEIGGDLKGGVAISGDGSEIIASIASNILFFNSSNNKPVWRYNMAGNAYNVGISKDGRYMAAATGGTESDVNTNLLILWNEKSEKPLWQYHASGNFHDVSLSNDGKYIAGSTGCPDRKAYLFSRGANTPLIRTDSLTRDSPVHRARISADGSTFAVGSESDAGAVFLFSKKANTPLWKFATPQGTSVRALSFTPDGKYVGAATFGGQAYIFAKEQNTPMASWNFNAALGGTDIADDGSFMAVGGTDDKVHILSKDKKTNLEVPFEEYVEEIDISADGRYIAAGTGGSVYFFETVPGTESKTYPCTTITEPKPINEMIKDNFGVGTKAEPAKSANNQLNDQTKLPGMLFGFGFMAMVFILLAYLGAVKFRLWSRGFFNKKIIIVLVIIIAIFLTLTIVAIVYNNRSSRPDLPLSSGSAICGNDICEPDLGENKERCPKDCSAGD